MKTRKLIQYFVIVMALLLAMTFSITLNNSNQSAFAKSFEFSQLESSNFKTDSVIVTLTEDATKQFLKYSTENFPEIDCNSVEDLVRVVRGTVVRGTEVLITNP